MFNIQYWQLAADAGLILALLYLALRFTRSNSLYSQNKSEELLRALKGLINEAEEAGRLLNERLIKRQQQLEKVLIELESAEGKIGQIESSADRVLNELKENQQQAQATLDKFNKAINQYSELEVEVSVEGQTVDQPTGSNNMEVAQPMASTTARPEEVVSDAGALNIYGEPIGGSKSLSAAIERETIAVDKEPGIKQLETVYDAAEKMLRAGYDLSAIVKQTRLPFDEVQMLARIIASAAEQVESPTIIRPIEQGSPVFPGDQVKDTRADARLGVLGSARQTRITV